MRRHRPLSGSRYHDRVRLVLASASPRRKELLSVLGIPFNVVPSSIDETPLAGESPETFVVRIAKEKCGEVASKVSHSVILSADTVVTIDNEILGKPSGEQDAVRMLRKLSGRDHWVYTAVCVVNQVTGKTLEGLDRTRVWFDPLDDAAIHDYIRRENVFDKVSRDEGSASPATSDGSARSPSRPLPRSRRSVSRPTACAANPSNSPER